MKIQKDLDINGKLEYAENYLISLDLYCVDFGDDGKPGSQE